MHVNDVVKRFKMKLLPILLSIFLLIFLSGCFQKKEATIFKVDYIKRLKQNRPYKYLGSSSKYHYFLTYSMFGRIKIKVKISDEVLIENKFRFSRRNEYNNAIDKAKVTFKSDLEIEDLAR
jgi:hypothetical protein